MSDNANASEFMAALPAFISEAAEQTESMEALLLQIEEAPNDRELLNSLFRCAHTVKGSAGIFGLNRVVDFTHHVETLLDKMREGQIEFSQTIGSLLLECNDQIRYLVELGFDDEPADATQVGMRADQVQRLLALTQAPVDAPSSTAPDVTSDATSEAAPDAVPRAAAGPAANERDWIISADFGLETFRGGMDPMAVCRYLETLGTVRRIHWNLQRVPTIETLVHDSCYIGFELELRSTKTQAALEEAFSFVEDDCDFNIVEVETPQEKIKRNIEGLSDVPRLGDLLIAAGAVSQSEINQLLETQAREHPLAADGERAKLGALLVERGGVAPDVVNAALTKQQTIRDKQGAEEGRFIRVQADRLDSVINLLGELVIAGAGTGAALGSFQNTGPESVETLLETLSEANQNMNRLIEEIRNSTLGLRMVPVGETFARFRRVVRDTAANLGKEVQFDIVGGETELDKSMVEKIADPLMHLVRNSLDHGLEPPRTRIDAGKSARGHLTLIARHEGGSMLIRIEDDGRGINRDRVLQRAWDKGLVERGVVPSDDAINMLIFEPGFSTAEQVTNLSGRGVGMDVVRSNIEALRGSIKLFSRPGKGLTVDIRLPLTLAIIDGFMVGVGESKFVLPLQSVVEVIESSASALGVDNAGRHCVELRGAVLPVVQLKTLYEMEGDAPERPSIVVVQSGALNFGIEVESLLGQQQTVIKPLGSLFQNVRGLSGSAILGSGEVALIVDVAALGQLASTHVASAVPSATLSSSHVPTEFNEPNQNSQGISA